MSESAPELLAPVRGPHITPPTTAGPTPAALIDQALHLVADDLVATEQRFGELLRSDIAIIPEVGGHLAFAGGKRFRPMLTLLAAAAAGFEGPERITVAAVGELLHTATLLHDDVIDEGEFRRGRPASRMRYGNGMAVLAGDYCLARALQAVAHTGRSGAVCSLADTVTRMAEGEVAQLDTAGRFSLDRSRYDLVIDRKTAALIAWCASVADLVAPDYVQPLRRYGTRIGYAFQIADDVLDVRPTRRGPGTAKQPGDSGKDPGQDIREGKMTLPIILACESDPTLHARVEALLAAGPPMSDEVVRELLLRIADTDAADRALQEAEDHVASAIDALSVLPPSPAKEALVDAAYYVVHRSL